MHTITYAMSSSLILSLLIGCGGDVVEGSSTQTTTKEQRASFYINKGNFVDVASFAYKKATDSTFTSYAMDTTLPGIDANETGVPSAYTITANNVNNQLKKVVVQNYQNSVEVKIVDKTKVNILFKDAEFTIDEEMSLSDFIARQ